MKEHQGIRACRSSVDAPILIVIGPTRAHLLVKAMVTRPVGRREVAREAAARAAMEKEWKGLRDKGV
jgi:hypothetical protein